MKTLTFLLCFVTTVSLTAQTKRIAHRSHSGDPGTFSAAASPDNFGLPSQPYRPTPDTSSVDSVLKKARFMLQQEPEIGEPAIDSGAAPGRAEPAIDSLQPNISRESPPSNSPAGGKGGPPVSDAGPFRSGLQLLALGIGLPVAIVVVSLLRKRRREDIDPTDAVV